MSTNNLGWLHRTLGPFDHVKGTIVAAAVGTLALCTMCAGEVIVPYVNSQWRYATTVYGGIEGFERPGFSDNSFSTGLAPFGSPACSGTPLPLTSWAGGGDLCLRREFVLTCVPAAGMSVVVGVDNAAQVWVNGSEVFPYTFFGGCSPRDRFQVIVPADLLAVGINLIAIRVRDDGGGGRYFGCEVSADVESLSAIVPLAMIAVCTGVNTELQVTVTGGIPSSFQWRKNGTPIDPLSNPSAGTSILSLTNITASDAGSYDCIVTNACGSVTSNPATLDVYCECPPYTQLGGVIDTPGFSQPADPAFPSSSLASALNNQNPRPLLNFDQIPGTTPGVSGDRSVAHTFTDIPNDLISASLRFRVRSGPNINPDGEGTDSMRLGFAVGSGETANFSGVNPARPYWTRFFGVGNATDAFFPGTVWGGSIDRSITLDLAALPRASQQGGGTINLLPEMLSRRSLDFVVSDDSGVDFAELTGIRTGGITVVWVREQPENIPVACPGSEAVFAITASGTAPFTYTWRKDGTPIDPLTNPSAATNTLTLPNITSSDIASYDCIVTNSCGSVTSNPATLTICPGDFNCDGGINGEDIESFFLEWEAGNAAADINEDGGIDGSDVELFFLRWEAGC